MIRCYYFSYALLSRRYRRAPRVIAIIRYAAATCRYIHDVILARSDTVILRERLLLQREGSRHAERDAAPCLPAWRRDVMPPEILANF
jgi:hypothetical protein